MNKRLDSHVPLRNILRALLVVLLSLSFTFSTIGSAAVRAASQPDFLAQTGDETPFESSIAGSTRTLTFPANALNFLKTSTILTQTATGIRWQASYAGPVYFILPRPDDYGTTGDVTLRLYFNSTSAPSAGQNVDFFIRPRSFNAGDPWADASGINGSPVTLSAGSQVGVQSFTIPADRLEKDQWVITIQRGGPQDTYPADVVVTSAALSYTVVNAQTDFVSFPANALNYDKTSTILTQDAFGIKWQASFASPGYLTLRRPIDWDGASDVTLRLFYKTTTAPGASSAVDFFIRPRAYHPGDYFGDAASMNGDPVPVTAANQVGEQFFTIPAARFGSKPQWVITIQRGGSAETYPGDVVLTAVSLHYKTKPSPLGILTYPANALNYDKASTILTQMYSGIRWQASYLNPAYLIVQKPEDWDGKSDVTLRLFFYTNTTPAPGNSVQFFIRPRAYNFGDPWGDASGLSAGAAPVTSNREVAEQVFTIPASRFGSKTQWVITLQRGGSEETYADDVILTSVALEYHKNRIFLPTLQK